MIGNDELNSDSLAVKKHEAWLKKLEKKLGKPKKKKTKKVKKAKNEQKIKEAKDDEEEDEDSEDEEDEAEPVIDEFTKKVMNLLEVYAKKFP